MHVGQAKIASLKAICQPRVVDAHAVKHCRVQVMNMNRITGNVVAIVIGLAMAVAGLDAASREPNAEAAPMMIPAIITRGEPALAVDRATKLAAENHEGVFE